MKEDKKKKQKKKKRPALKVFKIAIFSLLFLFLLAGVAVGGIGLAMIKTAPPVDLDQILLLNEPTTFYDDKGELIDEYKTVERRLPVSINDVPQNLKNAFIAIEDERFYSHKGIDYHRLTGAMWANVKNVIGKSGSLQGASTITQQLVKQRVFLESSLKDRLNVERKVQEMYLSTRLEKALSKDKILEAYMNTIPLGGNAYGIQSAAQQYFNKDVQDLSLLECAFIASAAQNPSVSYSTAYKRFKNSETYASPRTKAVLNNMLKLGMITTSEHDTAASHEITYTFKTGNLNKMSYEWFSRPVIEDVKRDLMEKYKKTEAEVNDMLANGGLKIYTTMNTELQNKTQEILDDKKTANKTKYSDFLFPVNGELNPLQPNLQSSAVVMDYHTGEVKVIVGGRGEQEALSYNRAASDKFLRSPGSTIKPLTVYSPAIDTKLSTAATVFEDAPIKEAIGNLYRAPGKPPYNPKNAPNTYLGYIPMRDGLKHSKNVVAVQVEHLISLKTGASYGEKFGLQLDSTDKTSMAALALGQLDGGELGGTNPLTIASAYGTFGNNGMLTKPRLYTKVLDKNGKILLETKYDSSKVISPQTAYIMYDMLKGPVSWEGTGPSARIEGMSVRGKTGTSSDKKNLYFSGLTPHYSAAVWIGNDDYSKIKGNISSNTAAKVWGKIMSEFHIGLEDKQIEKPAGIVYAKVCKDSGTLPADLSYNDPRGNRVYTEMFISGTVPNSIDNVHVKKNIVPKEDENGKITYVLATEFSDAEKIEERVFITRDYLPKVTLADQKYVVPTEYDDALPISDKDEDNDYIFDLDDLISDEENTNAVESDNITTNDNNSKTSDDTSENNSDNIPNDNLDLDFDIDD